MANVRIDKNTVKVTEERNYVSVSEEQNIVRVVEHGTPIFIGGNASNLFTYQPNGDYWYADEKIAIKGFGEYYNSAYKPIFIFESGSQKLQVDGFAEITANGTDDPFTIKTDNDSDIFKITTNEIAVFKMHNQLKTPVSGGLYFYNGDLFFGV
jgi:hypothetical protein